MNILLGIYRTPTFTERIKDSSLQTYPFSELLEDWDYCINLDILDLVAMACTHCDIIYFVLDSIKLPLNTGKSYTCNELSLILGRERFLNKTIFILDNKELSESEFKEWLAKE